MITAFSSVYGLEAAGSEAVTRRTKWHCGSASSSVPGDGCGCGGLRSCALDDEIDDVRESSVSDANLECAATVPMLPGFVQVRSKGSRRLPRVAQSQHATLAPMHHHRAYHADDTFFEANGS